METDEVIQLVKLIQEYGRGIGVKPDREMLSKLIEHYSHASTPYEDLYLRKLAEGTAHDIFGNKIYIRGLIECTNICRNDCLYCGIRKSNRCVERYRLDRDTILKCCKEGYMLGFRTFVLQGGEDTLFTEECVSEVIEAIKADYSDCAVTLSFGEQTYETYKKWRMAGADRYLLRHETADKKHYELLHPSSMSYDNRVECLYMLKELGFQVGSGFMVGSPYQTPQNLADDLLFLAKLKPQMIGIGPYVPHKDTPFAHMPPGALKETLVMISLLRLMFPKALIPATTSLATIASNGRELGFLHGANVVMPNLSPVLVRRKYMLYNNKASFGTEAAEGIEMLKQSLNTIGYAIDFGRGDYKE